MPTMMRRAAATVSTLALAMTAQPALATTLQEALAQAYRTNPTLNAARARLRATDEGVPLAKAEGRPGVSVSGSYDQNLHREINTALGTSIPLRSASGQATLSLPIYQGGIVRNSIRAAKEGVEAGQAELRATESSVFAQVVAAYLDVIADSAVVTFNRQNVRSLEVNLQASTDRFNVGDLTRTDVAQSDTRLALARANLESAEAQLISSKERYISLVGSEPVDLQPPPPLPGLPATPESAVDVALRDNPDILAAKNTRDAAHYQVNAARGQIAPRISGFVRGGYTDYLNSEKKLNPLLGVEGSAKSASAGVQLTVPLYQGGRPGALSRQAVARESQAIEQTVATERSVIAQTRSAYANWQASLLTIESTRKAVASGSLSLEGVQAENKAGTRTILDILDSQRDLLNAQVQYVSAQRNAYVAGFSLIAAMGHAEARDLSLDGGALYDPNAYYKTVRNKLFDFDFGGKATQVSTGTASTKPQDATIMPGGFGTQ
ncbi:TolC family outer membrane protein [Sphingobium sp. DEHP117]|uniref:TolC family outer membrane protein n=1 Tax=Sphingobium sp. DEHP117 TaxID=2993436 RepID=UPI0027D60404|nr:TolC family outer membrane protein [Sphingobium sp. DEHP117]MDQ4420016.1 TolC family outer membrane protein [Sphingobium sp. DEHP117]